uniref:Fatty acyl-CoA hydrolase precursor, medium chain-like n=1 Tax=Geotrypetes seraphini TaxID=260995 RepID=A0A6P8RAK4_GEOSA|nr:fatty acyl-CoA hydrolase precursor, medium chain-like [Geotrypetes seraphini]XP_033797842.1 fatty acyl-CoA hydrolase precursor, medium chain-like [Geotrypetes seraphini]XP_033797843.1 fatty acyl-CoA hydrolase precursor, medium chain-like [Geotrypetes seraphini]
MAFCATGLLSFCLISAICFTETAATVKGKGASQPTVVTKSGKLKGKLLRVKGTDRQVEAYLGIPFAKPPVGPLRFAPPQPAEPWNGVRDATAYPPMCLQIPEYSETIGKLMKSNYPSLSGSEDCLYLNVYTPAQCNKKSPLPVMVWIYGGAFVCGAASLYDGSALSAYENVVVVPIQYRLGVMGYFSTGDEHARGNWGFFDQLSALHWVQENIEGFGGDPDSVTVFGESVGGVSTSGLILSPLSKGLFHKAISESGSANIPGLVVSDRQVLAQFAKSVASRAGCEETNSAAMVSCLRKKKAEELLDPTLINQFPNVPMVVDGIFLLKSPDEMKPGEANPVPYLLGVNTQEFGWLLPHLSKAYPLVQERSRENITCSLGESMPLMGPYSNYFYLAKEEYFGDTEDPRQLRDLVLEMYGDMMFVIPVVKTARYHRDSGLPVYLYQFQHRPSAYGDSRPDFVKADHADEIGFVFGGPFLPTEVSLLSVATEEEKRLSRTMMKYWANFARTGNPNGEGLVDWPVYDHREQYLELNLKQKTGKKLKDCRVTFWTETLPQKVQQKTEL